MGDQAASAENDLVRRLLDGDEPAFDILVRQHHGAMMRVARGFISKPDVAEEVVQETWLAVLKGLTAFEGRSSLKTWIFHILANRARSRATREGRVVPFADLTPAGDEGRDPTEELPFTPTGSWGEPPAPWQVDTPEAIVLRREAVDQLQGALTALPPAQRTVVILRDLEGLDAAEVCNILQISETNQRVLLHRARTRLRKALDGVLGHRA
ncbi:MAG TPA: sigma-70 family RNA polymerase sigma factor [Vicinamibacterales bacterium]|jgi:RNA polymerase sigma-70 factor (ECF subfamily)